MLNIEPNKALQLTPSRDATLFFERSTNSIRATLNPNLRSGQLSWALAYQIMNLFTQEHSREMERYRRLKEYYAVNRRPALEWITFIIVLIVSLASAGRMLGLWGSDIKYSPWFIGIYILAFIAFVGHDALLNRAKPPARRVSSE